MRQAITQDRARAALAATDAVDAKPGSYTSRMRARVRTWLGNVPPRLVTGLGEAVRHLEVVGQRQQTGLGDRMAAAESAGNQAAVEQVEREALAGEVARAEAGWDGKDRRKARPRVQARYDTDGRLPDEIATFFHCAKCLDEVAQGAGVVSPKEYARTQVGIRTDGLWQVWCNRHEMNVCVIRLALVEA